jgi:hypothetical protein
VEDVSHAQLFTSLDLQTQEAVVIDSLTLDQYHDICYCYLSNWGNISISPDETVNLGAIIARSSSLQLRDSAEIASFPDIDVDRSDWYGADREVLEDGSTRYFIRFAWKVTYSNHVYSSFNSRDVLNKTLWTNMYRYGSVLSWLSQANHIFRHLQITSNFENYRTFYTRAWSHFCSNLLK